MLVRMLPQHQPNTCRDRIFQLSPVHASVIFRYSELPEFSESSTLFSKHSIVWISWEPTQCWKFSIRARHSNCWLQFQVNGRFYSCQSLGFSLRNIWWIDFLELWDMMNPMPLAGINLTCNSHLYSVLDQSHWLYNCTGRRSYTPWCPTPPPQQMSLSAGGRLLFWSVSPHLVDFCSSYLGTITNYNGLCLLRTGS